MGYATTNKIRYNMILNKENVIEIAENNHLGWTLRLEVDKTNLVDFAQDLFDAERVLRNSYEKSDNDELYVMAQGVSDYDLPVIRMKHDEYGDMFTIMATEEAIYVTKEQAMKFWNLVEKS